jgi:hypothetical protein
VAAHFEETKLVTYDGVMPVGAGAADMRGRAQSPVQFVAPRVIGAGIGVEAARTIPTMSAGCRRRFTVDLKDAFLWVENIFESIYIVFQHLS